MRFELSDTQLLLQKSARDFLANELPIGEVRRIMETDTAHDKALWRKMADQGWHGLLISEDCAGMGLGVVEAAVLFEQMGRALVPGPFHSTVAFAAPLIAAAGSEEQQQRYLTSIGEGLMIATAVQAPQLTVDGDGTLTGEVLFVPNAAEADVIVLACPGGVFVVNQAKAPGLTVTPLKAYDRTRRLYALSLNATPAERLENGTPEAIAHAENIATIALTAEMMGGMQRLVELTVAYAKTRKQFDQPIGKFQAVQHLCADMFLWAESTKAAVYYAAYALDQQLPDASTAVSVAKVYAADAYRECGNRAIQVHGGMGFTWECDAHLYYRRAKLSENAHGDIRYHRERIAQSIIDQPHAGVAAS